MINAYPARHVLPAMTAHFVRILGVNNANPTNEIARGVTVTRTNEGEYLATWAEWPGDYKGVGGYSFEAATPGDLKGYTVVFDTWDASTKSIAFIVYGDGGGGAPAAADLIANQYLNITFLFAMTDV